MIGLTLIALSGGFSEWIQNAEIIDHLAILQIFAVEYPGSTHYCRLNYQAVPE